MIELRWHTERDGQLVLHASPTGGHPWVGVTRYPWDADSQWDLLWTLIRGVLEVWGRPEPRWLRLEGEACWWTPSVREQTRMDLDKADREAVDRVLERVLEAFGPRSAP